MGEIEFWIKLEYLGMPYIAPSSLLVIMYFVGLERLVQKKLLIPLYGIPLITTLLVWTNGYHHLYYKSLFFREGARTPLIDVVMTASVCIVIGTVEKGKEILRKLKAIMSQ